METSFVLTGHAEAMATMQTLEKSLRNKILRKALRKGATILAKAVKEQAEITGKDRYASLAAEAMDGQIKADASRQIAGLRRKRDIRAVEKATQAAVAELMIQHRLKESIGVVMRTENGLPIAKVGARRGFKVQAGIRTRGKNKGRPWFYSPSRIIHLKEKGHGGRNPAAAHPILDPALQQAKNEAEAAVAATIQEELAKEAAKGQ